MKDFLVLFREPDGRTEPHPEEDVKKHQAHWREWMLFATEQGKLTGGKALTLNGKVIRDGRIYNGAYIVKEKELVGGYLLIKAGDIAEAAELIKTCPAFEFGGFAEIRECM